MVHNNPDREPYSELALPRDQKLGDIQRRSDELKRALAEVRASGWKPQTPEDINYVNGLRKELAALANGLAELMENEIAREKGHM